MKKTQERRGKEENTREKRQGRKKNRERDKRRRSLNMYPLEEII